MSVSLDDLRERTKGASLPDDDKRGVAYCVGNTEEIFIRHDKDRREAYVYAKDHEAYTVALSEQRLVDFMALARMFGLNVKCLS